MSEARIEVRTPPLWPSLLTAVAAVLAILLVPFTLDTAPASAFRMAVAGYVLGALVVPLGVAAHRYLRDEAKRSPYFDPRHRFDRVAGLAMVLGILAAVWHAFVVATELAR